MPALGLVWGDDGDLLSVVVVEEVVVKKRFVD